MGLVHGRLGVQRPGLLQPVLEEEGHDLDEAQRVLLLVAEGGDALAAHEGGAVRQAQVDQGGRAVADGGDDTAAAVDVHGDAGQVRGVGEVPHGAVAADVEDRGVPGGVHIGRPAGRHELGLDGLVGQEADDLRVVLLAVEDDGRRLATAHGDEVDLVAGADEDVVGMGCLGDAVARPVAGVPQGLVAAEGKQDLGHASSWNRRGVLRG